LTGPSGGMSFGVSFFDTSQYQIGTLTIMGLQETTAAS
jgi:hypothetical protein